VCRALDLVRDDVVHPGAPGSPIQSPATLDIHWLPIVGQRGWIVLMRDKRIRTRTAERERLLANGVGAFCLTGAGNYSRWMTLGLLVRRWDDIDETADRERPPYIFSVTQGGLRRLA
jgi:hypothetical protein